MKVKSAYRVVRMPHFWSRVQVLQGMRVFLRLHFVYAALDVGLLEALRRPRSREELWRGGRGGVVGGVGGGGGGGVGAGGGLRAAGGVCAGTGGGGRGPAGGDGAGVSGVSRGCVPAVGWAA